MVSWQPPAVLNGVITAYNVWYNQTLNCNGSLVSFSASVAGSVLTYTFTGLEEDTPYVFYVSAETSAGEGEAAMVMGRTREDGEWSELFQAYSVVWIIPSLVRSFLLTTYVRRQCVLYNIIYHTLHSLCDYSSTN